MIPNKEFRINSINAIILGETSERLFIYIHGQNGNKEEAHNIENVVCGYGFQILSIDLPNHGYPWDIVPELQNVMKFANKHWSDISIFANSIGAWFCMLSYANENLKNCFFVSPVLDMKNLISKMMKWANVSIEQLKKEQIIKTDFGQTLSWKYWEYVLEHPIKNWRFPTNILYGEKDNLIDYSDIEVFAQSFHCSIKVMINGEHWFHTKEQLDFIRNWLNDSLKNGRFFDKEV